jgi:hypothetical protein
MGQLPDQHLDEQEEQERRARQALIMKTSTSKIISKCLLTTTLYVMTASVAPSLLEQKCSVIDFYSDPSPTSI